LSSERYYTASLREPCVEKRAQILSSKYQHAKSFGYKDIKAEPGILEGLISRALK